MTERHRSVVRAPELSWIEPISAPFGNGKSFGVRAKRLAHEAGAHQLGCTLYELLPGKRSFPFHYHLAQEEALYVLEGSAKLRLGAEEVEVAAGDFVALPVGPEHAHQMINASGRPCRYLCFSTLGFPEIAVYPDSKKVGLLGGRASVDANGAPLVQVSPYGETLDYYDGEDD
jgi:uncharacterized cupin superfamily protein